MNIIEKIHDIIVSNQKKQAKGAEVWIVRWMARSGEFHFDKHEVAKCFLNIEDAIVFKKSLEEAKELLQYRENIYIEIVKQE